VRVPVPLTLALTRLVAHASRLAGRGSGATLPGALAQRLDPGLAGLLASRLPGGTVLVTGTNGKTTTTKMLAAVLAAHGQRVVTNTSGANLATGVTAALVADADLRGRPRASMGLFEVDEAALPAVAAALRPRCVVVLNLFRDQLDRYGELDTLAATLARGVAACTATVVLNADDPRIAALADAAAPGTRVTTFGLEVPAASGSSQGTAGRTTEDAQRVAPGDADRCPRCQGRLVVSRSYYAHLGHYACPNGDLTRPSPDVAVTALGPATTAGSTFRVASGDTELDVAIALPGTYNVYNAAAALAAAAALGVAPDTAVTALRTVSAAFGRFERVEVAGRTLYLLLVKNPAGLGQVLATFLHGAERPHVLLAVNDAAADGRDVSWLWDVDLAGLAATDPVVLTAGSRGLDMALRLKYDQIPARAQPSLRAALDTLLAELPEGGTGYVLPTYTAMLALRALLGQRTPTRGEAAPAVSR